MRRSLYRALLPMAILGSVAASCAMAQTWQALTPEGGEVYNIHGLPGGSGRVFATANNGIFVSTDSGRTWQAHPQQGIVGPFATYDPFPARSYAVERLGGLMRSDDFGDTWQPTGHVAANFVEGIAAIPGGLIYSGAGSPPQRSIDGGATFAPVTGVPATTSFRRITPSPYTTEITAAGSDNSLYRSTDGGASWSLLYASGMSGSANSLVYVSATHLVVSFGGQILASTDGGATWAERLNLTNAQVVRASDNGALVAMNGVQCRVSADGFATDLQISPCETHLPTSEAAPSVFFNSLASVRDGNNGYRVLANDAIHGIFGTAAGPWDWTRSNTGLQARTTRGLALVPAPVPQLWTGIFLQPNSIVPFVPPLLSSNDNGATWSQSIQYMARTIRSVVVDPTTIADPATMRVYAGGGPVLLTSKLTDSGIWRTTNGGANWSGLNAGLPESNIGNWSGVPISNVRKLLLDPRSCANPPPSGPCTSGPLRVLFGISDGAGSDRSRWRVLRSELEGDAHWVPSSTGLPALVQDAAGAESTNPVDIDAAADAATLYLSTFAIADNNDGSPRVPGILSGVFRSTNGGATWSQASIGLPLYTGSATTTRDVFALAAHPRRAGVLWASTIELGSTSSQINKSTDSGDHWTAVGLPMTNCDVRDLQVDSAAPEVIYAAGVATTGTGCLWRSEDAGLTWVPLHPTLPAYAVYDVRQDPQDRRRLVAATDHGVWSTLAPSDRIFTDLDN